MSLPRVMVWTDGACSPNPGPGGWGAVLVFADGGREELSGAEADTTNNRMEMEAAVQALARLDAPHEVVLYTDSRYLKDGIGSWLEGWRRRGWKTAAGQPVKNQDLWEELDRQLRRHQVDWRWVRGHAGNPENERADDLAVRARRAVARGEPVPAPAAASTEPTADRAGDRGPGVDIYTAITYSGKTRRGGWAAILAFRGRVRVLGGGVDGESANRLHILCAIRALEALTRRVPVRLHTVSGYLRDGAHSWLPGWKRRGWKTREGRAVSNQDLWKELDRLLERLPVRFLSADMDEEPPCHLQEAKELAREWEAG